jgi:hypothetical protein
MARPAAIIDWNKVDELLEAGCTGTEISSFFGIHPDTLYRKCEADHKIGFAFYSQQKSAKGEMLIRQKQYDMALAGDRGMLIWLGKNRLKQSDKHDVSHTGTAPVTVVNFSETPQKTWKEEHKKSEKQDTAEKEEGNVA